MTTSGPGFLPRRALIDPPPVATTPDSGQDWLRNLDWREFERLVGTAFSLQGYAVQATVDGADGGIDLVLTRDGERVFVQCKHWKAYQVGVKTVRELFGVVVAHQASEGIVVTSGRFTAEAREFAQRSGIVLLDGPALNELLAAGHLTAQAFASPELRNRVAPAPAKTARRRSKRSCWEPLIRLAASLAIMAGVAIALPQLITATIAPLTKPKPVADPSAVAVMGEQPMAIAASADGQQLFTANFVSGDVTVLNAASHDVVDSIDVPGSPTGIAVDARAHRLFVADHDGALHIVDLESKKVLKSVKTKPGRSRLGYDAKLKRLYLANQDTGTVTAHDASSGKVLATVKAPMEPTSIAVDSSGNRVFVLAGGSVFGYRGSDLTRTKQRWLEMAAKAIAFDSKRQTLLALTDREIHAYNLVTNSDRTVGLTELGTDSICVDPTEGTAHLADADTAKVTSVPLK